MDTTGGYQSLLGLTSINSNSSTIDVLEVENININGVIDLSQAIVGGLTTSQVDEGLNLYYTDTRVNNNSNVSSNTTHRDRTDNPHGVTATQVGIDDTDDISEGVTNLYYTDIRFDNRLATKTTTSLTEGSNLYYTDARFDTRFGIKTTTNLVEGTNLYYTDARFDTRLATKTTTNLAEGTNLYYTDARFDTRLAAKTTTNLTEGTNLYYTDARFDTRFGIKTTTDLTEGDNLYYTDARFDTRFGIKTTDNLTEGINLYYTDARVSANTDVQANTAYTAVGHLPLSGGILTGDLTFQTEGTSTSEMPALTSNTESINGVNYTASASSIRTPVETYAPWKVFNDSDELSTEECWHEDLTSGGYSGTTGLYTAGEYSTFVDGKAVGGEWVQLQKSTLSSISQFDITARQSQCAKDFTVAVSSDGTNFTAVYSTTGQTWTTYQTRTYTGITPTPGYYFRLIITAVNTFTMATLKEWRITFNIYGNIHSINQVLNLNGTHVDTLIEDVSANTAKVSADGSINTHSDVSILEVQDQQFLKYSSGSQKWENVSPTTTMIAEGTNLYYTDARFDTRLATKTTDNLAEASNLYYTEARVSANTDVKANSDYRSVGHLPLSGGGMTGTIDSEYIGGINQYILRMKNTYAGTINQRAYGFNNNQGATPALYIQALDDSYDFVRNIARFGHDAKTYFFNSMDITGDLTVSGTVDGVDLEALNTSVVKLTGDQVVAGTKSFSSRIQASGNTITPYGAGVELGYSGTEGVLVSFDRSNNLYKDMRYNALSHSFECSAVDILNIVSTGVGIVGNLSISGEMNIGGAKIARGATNGLQLRGTSGNIAGPHIQAFVSTDDYPVYQQLNLIHNAIFMCYDSYYDGSTWRSSSTLSNLIIYKANTNLYFQYDSGISLGGAITWNIGFSMDLTNGLVSCKKGLDVTGNITVSGTVDGVDLKALETDVKANTAKVSADGSINTHSDVNITTPADGHLLTYTSGEWKNLAPSGGTYVKIDGTSTMTGNLNMGNYDIINSNALTIGASTRKINITGGIEITGVGNTADGSHVTYFTTTDNYPIFQNLNFAHNTAYLTFDGYYDFTAWKKSHSTATFQISKEYNQLNFNVWNTGAAGSTMAIQNSHAMTIDANKLVKIYNSLDVTGNITVSGTVDGVDIHTLNTTANNAIPLAAHNTYVPTIGDGTNNFTLTSATGHYTVIGNMCHVSFYVLWTSKGSASGTIRLSLPFTSATGPYSSMALSAHNGIDASLPSIGCFNLSATNYVVFFDKPVGLFAMNQTSFTNAGAICGSGFFYL